MNDLVISNARILTLGGSAHPKRGPDMADMQIIDHGYVTLKGNTITAVESGDYVIDDDNEDDSEDILDVDGCVLMPCFVDCHTHACWAGSRLDEFEMALQGHSYLDILKAGGGIMSTVRAVREADQYELVINLLRRLLNMATLGSGTIEVKSGYGLDTETELKMLRAIHAAAQQTPQFLVGTFLGAHALDPDNPHYIEQTITETLPAVADEFPGVTCDAYCEEGAWSLENTKRLLTTALDHGCPIRVHTDQFHSLGMTEWAIDHHAVSVDHLEASPPPVIEKLAASETIGVALPCSGFHLDDRYAPARQLIDSGGALALATNYNPGSAPCPSVPFAIALACRKMGLTPAEAITAATHNAACVLGVQSRVGSIAPGMRADIQVLDTHDERELAYEFAGAGPLMVVLNGEIFHLRSGGDEDHE